MLKRLLAFSCLTLSIGANAALVTYTATEANVTGPAGLVGTFVYDTVAQQPTDFSELYFSSGSRFRGMAVQELEFVDADDFVDADPDNPTGEILMGAWTLDDGNFAAGTGAYVYFEGSTMRYEGWETQYDWLIREASGTFDAAVVPLPAAVWLFGSALMGLGVIKRKNA